jgi:nucleoside-diphosphate-sugar epimerase
MIVVTGGTGFVGSRLIGRLTADGLPVTATVRRSNQMLTGGVVPVVVGDLSPQTDWSGALRGARVVVHTAARVHVMRDSASDPLAEYRRANVEGALNLARQAARAGVQRFVFVSSVKVNGELTAPGVRFAADDVPVPQDPYGVSKLEAETGLQIVSRASGMQYVIVRPPLVYGPGVRANFLAMMRWLRRRVPLPLGAIHNQRSLVALDNLVDVLVACVSHPAAANQTFLVSDGQDLSTTELLRRLGAALGTPARLLPVPSALLTGMASLLGQRGMAQRLCGSLQVDINKTRQLLGWSPPITVDEGLRQAAEGFLRETRD